MMDIKVIISGNLTGFSRFYLSPGTNEVMAESRFKFDTYSYLMFLKPGGKVYSITFAPEHIAASVITPILDSFRRPGTLVVSVLIPRNQKVERISGQNNNRALYDLLNDLNDRFYEKNYKDGMINQNPAVLMQDYYSDIISRYTYAPDLNQKAINKNIDIEALTRKPGYVASVESNIPAYLSNLCRKSYEGFHYVFISPDAPQNIDEEPEEVQLYRVRIINKNMLLPEPVRLTQNIYPMQPGEGELDFDKNYTYQQALAGQCQQVSAVLTGETIEINYRFRQQEKKIRFEFYDAETNAPVDISLIRPSVESGNISRLLTSDSCIFLGTEIYSRFTMISKGSVYHIIDSIVDLRYISDGATVRVAVSQGCRIKKIFNAPYDISKTIRIRNHTGEEKVFFNVTKVFDEKITGQISDWTYEATADGYETAKGYLSSLMNADFTFRMTPKSSPITNTVSTGSTTVNSGSPKIFNGGGSLSGNGGKKRPKGLNWKKIAAVAIAGLALILFVVLLIKFIGKNGRDKETEQEEIAEVTKSVVLNIMDLDKYRFKLKQNDDYNALTACGFGLDSKVDGKEFPYDTIYAEGDNNVCCIKYSFKGRENDVINWIVEPVLKVEGGPTIVLSDSPLKLNPFSLKGRDTTCDVVLNVKTSHLKSYKNDKISNSIISTVSESNKALADFYSKIVQNDQEEALIQLMNELSKEDISYDRFEKIKDKYDPSSVKDDAVKRRIDSRIDALSKMFKTIREGFTKNENGGFKHFGYQPSTEGLSDSQKKLIDEIQWFKVKDEKNYNKFKKQLDEKFGKVQTLKDWQSKAEEIKNEQLINQVISYE